MSKSHVKVGPLQCYPLCAQMGPSVSSIGLGTAGLFDQEGALRFQPSDTPAAVPAARGMHLHPQSTCHGLCLDLPACNMLRGSA